MDLIFAFAEITVLSIMEMNFAHLTIALWDYAIVMVSKKADGLVK